MKSLILSFFILLVGFTSAAGTLRSRALRSMVCSNLEDQLYNDDLKLIYEDAYGNGEHVVVEDFQNRCKLSEDSFLVNETVFNDLLRKVVIIRVSLNLTFDKEIEFSGDIELSRQVSFDEQGQIQLEKWKISQSDVDYKLGVLSLTKIAQIIVDHSGSDGNVGEYDLATFSAKASRDELNAELEQQQSRPGFGSCRRTPFYINEDLGDSLYIDFEGSWSEYTYSKNLVRYLERKGHIKAILSNSVEGWSESCAYSNHYIYLDHDKVIILPFDMTT